MKRIQIAIFFLFINLCVFAENEIPDTFYGCTLGKSTIDEVQKNFIKRGIATKKTMANVITDCRVEHDGFVFNTVVLKFSGNLLSSIQFSYDPYGIFIPLPVDDEQKINLCKTVFSKYSSLDKVHNNALDTYNEQTGRFWLKERTDNKTTVEFLSDERSIFYTFSDNNLVAKDKLLYEENDNDSNKVDGVAGCKFGDSKAVIKRILAGKSQYLLTESYNHLMYNNVTVGRIQYDFADFFFDNNNGIAQLAAAHLSSSFPAIAHKKAIKIFESITSIYAQKYTNEFQKWNFDGSRTYSYGQYIDSDLDIEIPIMVTLSNKMSNNGSLRWYVDVLYYYERIHNILEDDI